MWHHTFGMTYSPIYRVLQYFIIIFIICILWEPTGGKHNARKIYLIGNPWDFFLRWVFHDRYKFEMGSHFFPLHNTR